MIRCWLIFFLFPVFLFAQENDSSLRRSVKIAYQNDLLTIPLLNERTDYYYTGGTFLEINLPALRKNPLSKILVQLPVGRDESFGITAAQLGFTPTSIKSDSILFGDRPFSGLLHLGFNRVSCNRDKQVRLTSALGLGVIGPLALGYETQKFIHANTNNPEPHGWQFQVKNDVYVNYALHIEKGLLPQSKAVALVAHGFVNAGTVYNNAGIGMTVYAGRMQPYFDSQGSFDRLQLFVYARGEGKLVARDATLQGGLFNTASAYVISAGQMQRAVFLGTAGIVFAYKRIRLELFNTMLSPEFKKGRVHAWGHLGMEFYF